MGSTWLGMRFDTASISKLFTSAGILQLIDQGRLDFEPGVIEFLGIDDSTIARDVNVYHLLTHTSGSGDDSEEEDGEIHKVVCCQKENR